METVDIQAMESKLCDVTVTAIPMTPKVTVQQQPPTSSSSSSNYTTVTSQTVTSQTSVASQLQSQGQTQQQQQQQQPGQSKYAQLLNVIEEMGREVRPTYAGSRSSAERLKRGIVNARILVRECLMETERSARQ